jgi:membrane protease YdiL (CAAX protease family)
LRAPAALHRDPLLLAAVLAGPLCWLLLYGLQGPDIHWGWPLREPWLFLLPVLFYPVIEEIIFRGLVQELVHDYLSKAALGPLTVANLLTSVLFTALHFIYHPPLWALLVFFPSLVFGFFKERSGGLKAPILLHAFYNGGYIWLFSVPG